MASPVASPPTSAPTVTWPAFPENNTITTSAPAVAPCPRPRMSGLPNGLRDSAWNSAPPRPSEAPTRSPTRTRGSRSSLTMKSCPAFPSPSNVLSTSSAEIGKSPVPISTTPAPSAASSNSTTTASARTSSRTESPPGARTARLARPGLPPPVTSLFAATFTSLFASLFTAVFTAGPSSAVVRER